MSDSPNMTRTCMKACGALVVLAGLLTITGCMPKTLVKTQIVEVPKFVEVKVDPQLTQPTSYAWPDRACWWKDRRTYCNDQLLQIIQGQAKAIEQCNADKASIRNGQ